jgi:hypothetical protein
MVDEESQDVASEAAVGAPVNRDRPRDPDVIDGEATRVEPEAQAKSAADATGAEAPLRSPSPDKRAAGALRPLAFGALGGLIVSALALAGGQYAFGPKSDRAQEDAGRLAALGDQAQHQGEEGQRQSAAIAGLDKRIGALEAASAAGASKIAAAAQAAQSATADVKSLKADVDGAKSDIAALAARLAKLESGAPQAVASADTAALAARVDKVEAALAAPKAETRAAPETTAPGNPAAIAIVAGALRDKLAAGIPFTAELTALQDLGVEPGKLTALQALAGGGPTDRALAASFDAVAPKVLAASSSPPGGGVVDRFLAHLRRLVQVRVLNETQGDDPAALVSQVEAAIRRGDVSGALATFGKLPEAGRQAAGGWAAQAGAKEAADEALRPIREAAIGKLAAGAKP